MISPKRTMARHCRASNRGCRGRAMASRMPAPNATRRKTVPVGPRKANRFRATVAPTWTDAMAPSAYSGAGTAPRGSFSSVRAIPSMLHRGFRHFPSPARLFPPRAPGEDREGVQSGGSIWLQISTNTQHRGNSLRNKIGTPADAVAVSDCDAVRRKETTTVASTYPAIGGAGGAIPGHRA